MICLVVVVCFALFVCFAFIQVKYKELINENFARNTFPYIYVWSIQRVHQWFDWMKLYTEAACGMSKISKLR